MHPILIVLSIPLLIIVTIFGISSVFAMFPIVHDGEIGWNPSTNDEVGPGWYFNPPFIGFKIYETDPYIDFRSNDETKFYGKIISKDNYKIALTFQSYIHIWPQNQQKLMDKYKTNSIQNAVNEELCNTFQKTASNYNIEDPQLNEEFVRDVMYTLNRIYAYKSYKGSITVSYNYADKSEAYAYMRRHTYDTISPP